MENASVVFVWCLGVIATLSIFLYLLDRTIARMIGLAKFTAYFWDFVWHRKAFKTWKEARDNEKR